MAIIWHGLCIETSESRGAVVGSTRRAVDRAVALGFHYHTPAGRPVGITRTPGRPGNGEAMPLGPVRWKKLIWEQVADMRDAGSYAGFKYQEWPDDHAHVSDRKMARYLRLW